MRIANCTSAAQLFHLLRRQALLLEKDPLPLIVLTPKSLLRHPMVASTPRELAEGRFQPLIDDLRFAHDDSGRGGIRRLLLCSGKFAVDLMMSDAFKTATSVAICRVEQLYPLPIAEIEEVMARYPGLQDLVWAQEEPENMGGWHYAAPYLRSMLRGELSLRLLARPRSSSPAEGSAARHARVQQQLIARAFDVSALGAPDRRPVAMSSRK